MKKLIEENNVKYYSISTSSGKDIWSVKYHRDRTLDYSANSYGKQFCDEIIRYAKLNNGPIASILNKHSAKLRDDIIAATKFLDDAISSGALDVHKVTITERVYCILNDISEVPRCENDKCRKPLRKFNIGKQGEVHHEYCCIKCTHSDQKVIDRKVAGFINRPAEEKLATKLKKRIVNFKAFWW